MLGHYDIVMYGGGAWWKNCKRESAAVMMRAEIACGKSWTSIYNFAIIIFPKT